MRTIIVDDEPKAIELLEGYIKHFSGLSLVGTFRNGLKSLEFLNTEAVDLIFLDINMPHLNGLSLSKMIDKKTKVIFTTAYSEYAVESYEVEAQDYLLKPISFERFSRSVTKLLSRPERHSGKPAKKEIIEVKSGSKMYRLSISEIEYLEKDGNYMIYYWDKQKLLVRQTVAEALELLPASFLQIHRSFLVNSAHIEFYNANEVSVHGRVLPVGNQHRERFLKFFEAG